MAQSDARLAEAGDKGAIRRVKFRDGSVWRKLYQSTRPDIVQTVYAMLFLRSCLGTKVGRNVGIAPCRLGAVFPELLSIGDGSAIGWHAVIACHEFTHTRIVLGRVTIGKNVLIGGTCAIRAGVTIGDNSVVAGHSLVDQDIPPNELWAGVPARRVQKLKKLT